MLPNKWSKASSCPFTVQFFSAYGDPAKKSLQSVKAYSIFLHASVSAGSLLLLQKTVPSVWLGAKTYKLVGTFGYPAALAPNNGTRNN